MFEVPRVGISCVGSHAWCRSKLVVERGGRVGLAYCAEAVLKLGRHLSEQRYSGWKYYLPPRLSVLDLSSLSVLAAEKVGERMFELGLSFCV